MSRVTPSDVKQIITTTLDDSIVQIWIDNANTIINNKADCIGGGEDLLTKVELQLSCHFIAMLDGRNNGNIKQTKIDVFATEYSENGISQEIINKTPYGITANMLANGCLLTATKARASVDFF